MPRWIDQTLKVNEEVQIDLNHDSVWIGGQDDTNFEGDPAIFMPKTRDEANCMSIALKMAAKRLEEIGKGLS